MLYLKLQQTFKPSESNYELELGQSAVLTLWHLWGKMATSGLELISLVSWTASSQCRLSSLLMARHHLLGCKVSFFLQLGFWNVSWSPVSPVQNVACELVSECVLFAFTTFYPIKILVLSGSLITILIFLAVCQSLWQFSGFSCVCGVQSLWNWTEVDF